MAVTRIKTNQVTDSAITTDKLSANAVTAAKLEDNLTYGSNLTITGNLTVNGTTSQVNSTTMTVDDPVLLLSEGQTGAGAVDIGFMGERGDDTNVAFVWDESADEFVAALVSDSDTSTTVTITDYADIRVGGLTVDDNATIGGTLGVTGNVTLSGDITFGGSSTIDANTNKIINVTDPTTDQDAATKAYVDSVASSGFTVTDGTNSQVIEINGDTLTINGTANEITTLVSATDTLTIGLPDNVTIGDALTVTGAASVGSTLDVTGLASLDGGIDVDGAFTVADTSGNVSTTGTITATGAVTGGSLTDGTATLSSGALSGATTGAFSSNVTVGGTLGVTGTTTAGVVNLSGLLSADAGIDVDGAFTVADTTGNVATTGTLSAGNTTVATLDASGLASLDGGIDVDGAFTVADTTGNVATTGTLSAGNTDVGTLDASGLASLDGGIDVDGAFTVANTTGNVSTSGTLNADGNTTLGGTATVTGATTLSSTLDVTGAANFNDTTGSSSTTTGAVIVDGGVGIAENLNVGGNTVITGNLTVNGTTTTVESTVTTIADPVMTLGDDGSTDSKDRGIEFKYNDGSAKVGFFGWDQSADSFTLLTDATNTSEAFSGTAADFVMGGLTATTGAFSSNATVGGTLGVTGAATFSSTISSGAITSTGAVEGTSLTDGTATLSGGSLTSAVNGTFSGTVTGGTLTDGTASITSGALSGATTGAFSSNVTVGGTLDVTGASTVAAITASGLASLDGGIDVDGVFTVADTTGNVATTGTLSAGNTTVGTLGAGATTLSSTLDVSGLASLDGGIDVDGAFTVADTSGNVATSGTLSAGATTLSSAAVSDLTSGRVVLAGTSGELEDSGNLTFDGSTLTLTGALSQTGNANITGTLDVSGTAALDGGITVDTTAFIVANTSGNVTTAGTLDVAGLASLDGGIDVDGAFTVADTSGNVATSGTLSVTGATIDLDGAVTINDSGNDVDFVVEGSSVATLLTVDAGTDTVVVGNGTATSGATLKIDATDSVLMPTGTTAQRPGTPVTAMMRWNSTNAKFEYYDGSEWKNLTADFTVIASQTFNGDDSTTAFTLSEAQTTASCIVSINGVLQLPTTAYGVSGTTLTFTEAPATGDVIEVRKLTTTSTVTGIDDGSGSATIDANGDGTIDVLGNVTVTGSLHATGTITADGDLTLGDANTDTITLNADIGSNIVPDADDTYSLGTASKRWSDLYVAGSTIHLGDLQLKDGGSGTFAVYQSDGSTPATLDSDNVDTTTISQLNSSVAVTDTGTDGNIAFTVDGVTIANMTDTGLIPTVDSDGTTGFDLGSSSFQWRDVYVSSGSLYVNGQQVLQEHSGTIVVSADSDQNVQIKTEGTGDIEFNPSGSGIVQCKGTLQMLDGENITNSAGNDVTFGNNIAVDGITSKTTNGNLTLSGNGNGNVTLNDDVSITGNLTVGGTTTTVNSTTLTVADLNITVAQGAANAAAANGAGLTVDGASATITYGSASDNWNFNKDVNVTGGLTTSGDITVSGGDITLGGTGRIQGIDTVSASTDAANKSYVDSAISSLSSTTLTEGNSNVTVADSGTGTFTVTLDAATHTTFNSSGITLATGNFVGTATEAQYADLAEKYTSDEEYEAGTVVMFGGEAEITMAMGDMNPRVAGVISTDPAYMMNSEAEGQYVALTGRVPCKVMGQVRKGDMMVSAGNGMARSEEEPKMGTVIGKALEDFDGDEGVIEVVVGRM
jgi:hypothetical protein